MKTISLWIGALLFVCSAPAAVLPGVIGPWKQASAGALEVKTDRALWDEYGLQESEQGVYHNALRTLAVEAWRLADSTSAMGAFLLLRPSDARPAPKLETLTPHAAITASGALVALGNYVVRFEGAVPEDVAVANMFRSMPRYENSGLPTFISYLPAHERPNSERYIQGPVALQAFVPEIEPAMAGFRMGGEAAIAEYQTGSKLALFSYPTPAIARNREAELAKVPGAIAKRSGPLVAVVLHSQDKNSAETLLSQIRYRATVTTGEKPSTPKDNPGNLLLNVFYLVLILGGFCLCSGVAFGLIRMAFRRSGASGDGEEILALHLRGR